ncbi:hypothetical protein BH20ACT5_BH20ACT5_04580 [soil metagenome]
MRLAARVAVLAAAGLGMVLLAGTPAQAHPLGNFTVNHYNGLSLYPDRVDLLAIVDSAEIPTAQELSSLDTDDDGEVSTAELASRASTQCAELAEAISLTVGGASTAWTVRDTALETLPGAASLPTLRLTCELRAEADLSAPTSVALVDDYGADRVGWREITAIGDGVRLIDPAVPSESISDELRDYPDSLLSSPVDVGAVTLRTEPGDGDALAAADIEPGYTDPFTRLIGAADAQLTALIGSELTPLVGALAVVLALLLGAGHAVLPGHGKTVMAAYLAGSRGSRRDALLVGATVTATHTVGVLVLGLLVSLGSAFAGEQALRWLGVISGLLVAGIGVMLLRSALRSRRSGAASRSEVLVGAAGLSTTLGDPSPGGHAHGDHPHGQHSHGGRPHDDHSHHDHSHGPGHSHSHGGPGRSGLIGMGIAGGLVPSPSALIVLLASVGLGRTVFGVLLVFAYGLGMAATLTAVGLLLVRLRGRLDNLVRAGRLRRGVVRVAGALPIITAVLVLVVGLTLATRGVLSPV